MDFIVRKIREYELLSASYIMGLRVATLAGKFLLGLFIVRFIGLEAMGIYGLVMGAAAILPMVARLGIFSSLSRIAVGQSLEQLTRNLRHYGYGSLAIYAALFPVIIGTGFYIGQPELAALAFFVILFEHISTDIFVLTNNLGKPKLANELLALQSAVWIYLYMILAWMIPDWRTLDAVFAFWIIGGLIPSFIAFAITRHWPWTQAFAEKLSPEWYKTHFRGAWRIYLSDMINAVSLYLDRYLITLLLGLEAAGIYVLFWQVVNAICNLVGAGVLQVYRPRLIAAHAEKNIALFNTLFWQSAYKSAALALVMAVASAIVVPYLIGFTGKEIAADYMPLFWFMLLAMMVRIAYDVCAYTLFAEHRDGTVLRNGILKLCTTATIGTMILLLIGIYGAPLTTIIAESFAVIYTSLIWTQKRTLA
jgi:O-antigen/teichoic acid export membrane protein